MPSQIDNVRQPGDAITISNNQIDVNTGAALEIASNTIEIKVDDVTIEVDGDELVVKEVTAAQVNIDTDDVPEGVQKYGKVLQTVSTSTSDHSQLDGKFDYGNSALQITGGAEILTLNITPIKSNSMLRIEAGVYICANGVDYACAAIFKSGSNPALAAGSTFNNTQDPQFVGLSKDLVSGGTSELTFSLRGGGSIRYSFVNRSNTYATLLGASFNTYLNITEYEA